MDWVDQVVLVASGAVAGALNSVAGGGSFLTFPSLLFVGVAPVMANATSAVALWPGQVGSAIAYRSELSAARRGVWALCFVSALGGFAGAVLLLRTPNVTFSRVIPFLMLVASLVFTFGGRFAQELRSRGSEVSVRTMIAVQLVLAMYGGYFGGGMGIVMLAAFSAMGMTNIHAMNALKTLLATLINLVAVGTFIAAGAVSWRPGLVMLVAATISGYSGAAMARRIEPRHIRRFVLWIAWGMTAWFFLSAYGRSPHG